MLGPKTDRGLPEDGPPERRRYLLWKALLLHSILLMEEIRLTS